MKKKVVSLLMAAAMTMTMLAGCGSTDAGTTAATTETKTEEAAATTEEAATTEASGDVVTVRMMRNCFNVVPSSDRTKEVQDAINEYIKDKINVQIELTDISSNEYADKANLAIANNEADLFWTASWLGTVGTKDLYAANAAKDLTDLLPGTTLYDSMDSKQWEASKYGGKNFFIPVYKDNVEGYNVMLRKDLVDKYGIDVASIKTLKDLTPALEAMSAEGLRYTYLTQRTAMFYRWYIDSFDFFTGDNASAWVAVDRSKDEVVNTIKTDEFKEFATLMAEWREAGYLSEDDATKTTDDTTIQGDEWGCSWWTDVPNNAEANGRYNKEVVMAKVTKNWAHTDSCLGSCYAIAASASDEATKAALDFMGLLYTDSTLANMYTYGIEGKDWSLNADGYVEKAADASYNHSMWESANATVVTAEASSPYTAQMYLDFNNGAEISCANGFQFDKTPVEDKYVACCNAQAELGFALENGAFAVADVDAKIAEYEAALEDAGVDDVIAEFSKQYEEWKKTR